MAAISNKIAADEHPRIIQGGMGVGVSNWRLARSVAMAGELGVVSGTALDTVLVRRLQDGDPGGHMRRGLAAYPNQELAERVLAEWFRPEGRAPDEPYRLKRMPVVGMRREETELLILANFVEIYLAKEGHEGRVGVNYLEKIQLPTLPSLLGAMLAGVDYVLMGGGIPLALPGVLDSFARLEAASLKVNLEAGKAEELPQLHLDPREFLSADQGELARPKFLAIISSDILAKTFVRKASGRVDGFVIEHHRAGGHNAPPRRDGAYGPRDVCSIERVRELGLPFWLAGGYADPRSLVEAMAEGAEGVQVGTAFACCDESGIEASIKAEVIAAYRSGDFKVETDFRASPTGYPFKRVDLKANEGMEPCRVCDLGYLRHVYLDESGRVNYRCPAGPLESFLAKGGSREETEGKRCLCNGLLTTVGLGQVKEGATVPPLLTWGEDMSFLDEVLKEGEAGYSALRVIEWLRSPAASAAPGS